MKQFRWLLLVLAVGAAGSPVDPDWPCRQRLVPTLAAGSIWTGPPAASDWRSDARVATLVGHVAPRSVAPEDGASLLKAFAATLQPGDRQRLLPMVFAGIMDETNAQRSEVIERLRDIARRQRDLTATETRVTAELRSLPETASTADKTEVISRRAFLIRNYEEVGRTIRYACEIPVQLEARVGTYAEVLRSALAS